MLTRPHSPSLPLKHLFLSEPFLYLIFMHLQFNSSLKMSWYFKRDAYNILLTSCPTSVAFPRQNPVCAPRCHLPLKLSLSETHLIASGRQKGVWQDGWSFAIFGSEKWLLFPPFYQAFTKGKLQILSPGWRNLAGMEPADSHLDCQTWQDLKWGLSGNTSITVQCAGKHISF